ncbi:AAA family ATPase [Candidatus Nitronereus thalassa]|uniref:AAA family ATPase n=1 Tax=Candidatus Nitronereus thalassa TaxID=3020898 RepID=A0ABU3K9I2_9BACT|nr:AAA family ATPase [Candidatus Nitronereus thalassa]MDT7043105.1 AAA family ATPase [Candidatus Nitronereus thalassa]
MRIAEMIIDGFGVFREVTVSDLDPKVTVFEGHNEAGKTTLMAYIRAVLFGFEGRRNGANRYEPARGGRHGGALVVDTEDGRRFRIERVDSGARGRVKVSATFPFQHTVSEVETNRSDEESLRQLLYGTSKLLYQNVFAFGIGELERLDTLQADEVSHHIYTVGMGTGLTPLTIVQSGLDAEQSQLFKPGGRKPLINQLLQALEESQTAIRDLQTLPDEYDTLQNRLVILDQEIQEDQTELEETKTRCDWLESLVKARTDWEQLQVVRQELEEIPTIESFPAGGIERLEQVERALGSVETRLDEIRSTIRKAVERRVNLRPDPRILKNQNEIEALEDLRGQFKTALDGLSDLRSRAEVRRKVLDEMLGRLGPAWDDARLDRFEASIPIRERVRGLRDRLEACRQEVIEANRAQQDVERMKKEKDGELERLQEKLEQLAAPDCPTRVSLDERERAIRQWVQLHHQRALTQQHRQDLQVQTTALEDQVQAITNELTAVETRRDRSWWALLGVSAMFIGLGTYAGVQQEISLTIVLASAGIVAIGLLAWWRHELQEQRRVRMGELQDQIQSVTLQWEELQGETQQADMEEKALAEEMTQLSQQVLGIEMTSLDVAESARRALEAERRLAERREDINVRIQDDEETLVGLLEKGQVALKVRQEIEANQESAQQAWQEFLLGLELPEDLTPDGALEVIAGAERAQGQLREWRDVTRELQHVERFVVDTARQLNKVLEQCGWDPVEVEHSPGALTALRKSLEQSLASHQELARLTELIAERQTEVEAAESEKVRYLDQLQALLRAGGASDSESFRQRAGLYTRQVELERQQRQLEFALKVHAGSAERYQDMEASLSNKSRAELEREWSEAKREGQQRLVDVLTKKLQEKGRVEQRLQDLERNEQLSFLMLERQELLAQLQQHANRWAVRSICQHLLDKARQVYERERQPAVLREASKFFASMTGGRYVRVKVPLGEMRLEVEAEDGKSSPTDILSRGTAEQLYLAMRLAFICEYAKHAGPLPLVIDDILVNFDPERAKATIAVLGQIALTHQVLVFTCHPHVSRWFEETLDGVSIRPIPKSA